MNVKNIGIVSKLNTADVKIQPEDNSQSRLCVTDKTNPNIAEDMAASIKPIVWLKPVIWSKDITPKPIKG